MSLPPFKDDKYRDAREGYSVWLRLDCRACESPVAQYQKDGPGPLLRCYFNRFESPDELADLVRVSTHKHEESAPETLSCESCHMVLGDTFRYRDGRLAFLLRDDSVTLWQLLDGRPPVAYVPPEVGTDIEV